MQTNVIKFPTSQQEAAKEKIKELRELVGDTEDEEVTGAVVVLCYIDRKEDTGLEQFDARLFGVNMWPSDAYLSLDAAADTMKRYIMGG